MSDISGKNIGVLHSNVEKDVMKVLFPHASVTEYDKVISLFLDMESNRCDVAVMTQDTSQLISRSPAPNGYEFGGVNLQFGGVKIKKWRCK